jgi:hypothetical protein
MFTRHFSIEFVDVTDLQRSAGSSLWLLAERELKAEQDRRSFAPKPEDSIMNEVRQN